MKIVLGVLGGMGPAATIDFFDKMVSNTSVDKEEDHIHVIINNNPQIPSRVKGISGAGESPLPFIIEGIRLLELVGASFVVMPCNTAHYWYDQITEQVNVPVLHIIKETAREIKDAAGTTVPKVLLLATEGTVKAGLYKKELDKRAVILTPNQREQRVVDNTIERIKRGLCDTSDYKLIQDLIEHYKENNMIDMIIGGCTEIPLMYPHLDLTGINAVDPTLILARAAIKKCGKKLKSQ
ncbi:amino acid racemase [Bacillus sp. H-16]|uniref:amino acid racemase n=1 Tax=Alteribacter salitolerans TaxID=2912333 RepID=UPI0019638A3E|nr:amino acid racemase [Alteribacter salitolerans]